MITLGKSLTALRMEPGSNRGARDNAGGNDIIDRANGVMSPSGTKIAIFSNSHGKKAYKSKI